MKILILMSICVSITYQQYYPRMMTGMIPGSYFDYFPSAADYNEYEALNPYTYMVYDDSVDDNIEPRNRKNNFKSPQRLAVVKPLSFKWPLVKKPTSLQSVDKQNERFLFYGLGGGGSSNNNNNIYSGNNNNVFRNPLLKTVAIITSSATVLTVSSCVALTNLPPAPIVACGRKRRSWEDEEVDEDDEDYQFPIAPAQVTRVLSTVHPDDSAEQQQREAPPMSSDVIASSKEEHMTPDSGGINDSLAESVIGTNQRQKRFFFFNNNNNVVYTQTSWEITTSTFFSTLNVPGPTTVLPCLPKGYSICPIAVGK